MIPRGIFLIMAMLVLLGGGPLFPGGSRKGQSWAGSAEGVLAGRVTRGPVQPAERAEDRSGIAPATGIRLILRELGGREVASITSDSQGNYRLPLPAGEYLLEMAPLPPPEFTKDLPAPVTITPGQETRLDIRIDTGIR